ILGQRDPLPTFERLDHGGGQRGIEPVLVGRRPEHSPPRVPPIEVGELPEDGGCVDGFGHLSDPCESLVLHVPRVRDLACSDIIARRGGGANLRPQPDAGSGHHPVATPDRHDTFTKSASSATDPVAAVSRAEALYGGPTMARSRSIEALPTILQR